MPRKVVAFMQLCTAVPLIWIADVIAGAAAQDYWDDFERRQRGS